MFFFFQICVQRVQCRITYSNTNYTILFLKVNQQSSVFISGVFFLSFSLVVLFRGCSWCLFLKAQKSKGELGKKNDDSFPPHTPFSSFCLLTPPSFSSFFCLLQACLTARFPHLGNWKEMSARQARLVGTQSTKPVWNQCFFQWDIIYKVFNHCLMPPPYDPQDHHSPPPTSVRM